MKREVIQAIAILLILISLTFSILWRAGITGWDLGFSRWLLLLAALALLIYARGKGRRA
jgi:hypothetical protein